MFVNRNKDSFTRLQFTFQGCRLPLHRSAFVISLFHPQNFRLEYQRTDRHQAITLLFIASCESSCRQRHVVELLRRRSSKVYTGQARKFGAREVLLLYNSTISLFDVTPIYFFVSPLSVVVTLAWQTKLFAERFPATGHSSGRRQLHLRGSLFVVWFCVVFFVNVWLLCLRIKLLMFSVQLQLTRTVWWLNSLCEHGMCLSMSCKKSSFKSVFVQWGRFVERFLVA